MKIVGQGSFYFDPKYCWIIFIEPNKDFLIITESGFKGYLTHPPLSVQRYSACTASANVAPNKLMYDQFQKLSLGAIKPIPSRLAMFTIVESKPSAIGSNLFGAMSQANIFDACTPTSNQSFGCCFLLLVLLQHSLNQYPNFFSLWQDLQLG